jgi:hypothetical protein
MHMKKTMNSVKRTDGEKRMAVLRLELDYELATLYEAMMETKIGKTTSRINAPSSMTTHLRRTISTVRFFLESCRRPFRS